MSMRRSLPRIALTLVLAAIAGWVVLHRDQINLATLDAWLAWLGPWAPIGHMMLFALGTVAFVPGVVFSLAGGALFGLTRAPSMRTPPPRFLGPPSTRGYQGNRGGPPGGVGRAQHR